MTDVPSYAPRRLTEQEVSAALDQLDGWILATQGSAVGMLECRFKRPDFVEAMALINKIAELAETMNHHPDLHIRYNLVTVQIWTHDIGGISQYDVELAQRISSL